MKIYQHWSTDTLNSKKRSLYSDIEQWERILTNTKSFLIKLSVSHNIKKAKEEIHAINAELCYRESLNKESSI